MKCFRSSLFGKIIIFIGIFLLCSLNLSAAPKDKDKGNPNLLDQINQLEQQIEELQSKAFVEQTGQTVSYSSGDDGDHQSGVASPNPRFTDNLDGTVTDNLTGLIWLQDVGCLGVHSWFDSLIVVENLEDDSCGLTDGSLPGDWRLPNVKELLSLIDYGNFAPALPNGHPFINIEGTRYWSSTSFVEHSPRAWWVIIGSGMSDGTNHDSDKLRSDIYSAWAVKGG